MQNYTVYSKDGCPYCLKVKQVLELSELSAKLVPVPSFIFHHATRLFVVARLGNNFSVTIPMDRITSICKASDVNEFNKIVGSNL